MIVFFILSVIKKWLLWNMENIYTYDYNYTFMNESNFSIK